MDIHRQPEDLRKLAVFLMLDRLYAEIMTTEANPRPVLGVGINHVQALRDALSWSIAGQALLVLNEPAVTKWLAEQGLEDSRLRVADCRLTRMG